LKGWVEKFNEGKEWTYSIGKITMKTVSNPNIGGVEPAKPPLGKQIREDGYIPLYTDIAQFIHKKHFLPRPITVEIVPETGARKSRHAVYVPYPPDDILSYMDEFFNPENWFAGATLEDIGYTPTLKNKYLNLYHKKPERTWVAHTVLHEIGHLIFYEEEPTPEGEVKSNKWALPLVREFVEEEK